MNAGQQKKYWWLFGPVRDYLKARGYTPAQIEERRHALHRKALGKDKSSTAFTSADFDAVKREFRAEWDGGNLNAQMDADEEPEQRKEAVMGGCMEATADMFALGDDRLADAKSRLGYIAGTARNVVRKELEECTEAELGTVRGCLERRVRVMRDQRPDLAELLDEKKADQPF